jgi:hypothetical protein
MVQGIALHGYDGFLFGDRCFTVQRESGGGRAFLVDEADDPAFYHTRTNGFLE